MQKLISLPDLIKQHRVTLYPRLALFNLDLPILLGLCLITMCSYLVISFAIPITSVRQGLIVPHKIYLFAGIFFLLMMAQIKPETYKQIISLAYVFNLLLLILVLLIGDKRYGAGRWLDLGPLTLQPSEFAKIVLPLTLAAYFSSTNFVNNFRSKIIALLLVLTPTFLIAIEPDLSTAVTLMMIGVAMFIVAGWSLRSLLPLFLLFICVLPLIWFCLYDYQQARIMNFLFPNVITSSTSYQNLAFTAAFKETNLFGQGFNIPSHYLYYLSRWQQDSAFAIVTWVYGIIGGSILIILYSWITLRCMSLAKSINDSFASLAITGLGLAFYFTAFINIAPSLDLLPFAGAPLPLLTKGGTGTIVAFAAFGIVMSLSSLAHRKH